MIGFKGDPYEETKTEDWFRRYSWKSPEQKEEFILLYQDWVRRVYEYIRPEALDKEFAWFDLAYGLGEAGHDAEGVDPVVSVECEGRPWDGRLLVPTV